MQGEEQLKQSNRRLAGKLGLVGVAMFGFGFALVPLYDLICDTFGLNGRFIDIEKGTYTSTEGRIKGQALAARADLSRTVTVQFMATLNQNMAWEFAPMVKSMQLHPGEIKQVKYYAKNLTDQTMIGQAIPSVAPGRAAKYFTKMECFCFNQQTFQAGEAREMPLVFVVDPDLPKDVSTITLGYTFFDTSKKAALQRHTVVSMAAVDKQTVYRN